VTLGGIRTLGRNLRNLCNLRIFSFWVRSGSIRAHGHELDAIRYLTGSMHSAVRLFVPVLFVVLMLGVPASPAFQNQSAEAVPTPSAPPTPDRETIIRLKIFLDQHSFGPGEIDGRWNDLCANALGLYRAANGNSASGIDSELKQQLSDLTPLSIGYQIKPEDLVWVGKSPQKPAAQAKRKLMPYPSIADFVAERFHTNLSFLTSLNQGRNLDKLHPGDTVQVPNVPPFELSGLKEADDVPPRPQLKNRRVEVDTKNKTLTITDNGKILAAFPITPGSKQLPAPIGIWQIVKIATLPWFRWDKAMLIHGKRSGDFHNIPPGPRNEVGVVWIGLNKKGIGIHGTNNPDSIGRSASHGCIRLANWDALQVLNAVTQGVTVEIK
jgi:lipoprotein-anchoring transpeptidase ErfK/SrfK